MFSLCRGFFVQRLCELRHFDFKQAQESLKSFLEIQKSPYGGFFGLLQLPHYVHSVHQVHSVHTS